MTRAEEPIRPLGRRAALLLAAGAALPSAADLRLVNGMLEKIYRERTQVPAAEIARFEREQVIYDAQQAQSFGIVDHVTDLRIPGSRTARVVFVQ